MSSMLVPERQINQFEVKFFTEGYVHLREKIERPESQFSDSKALKASKQKVAHLGCTHLLLLKKLKEKTESSNEPSEYIYKIIQNTKEYRHFLNNLPSDQFSSELKDKLVGKIEGFLKDSFS